MRIIVVLAAIVALLFAFVFVTQEDETQGPPYRVAKETTYFTEPLDEYGYVDYAAALDIRGSQGVTAENNALAKIISQLGPGAIPDEQQPSFYRRLGVEPPGSGPFYQSWSEFVQVDPAQQPFRVGERREDPAEQLTAAMEGLWAEHELPIVARWLKSNNTTLDAAVEASRQPKYYAPVTLLDEPRVLINMSLDVEMRIRDIARALASRATLRAARGDMESALEDIDACHRWAALVSQRSMLLCVLVGYSIHGMAIEAELVMAQSGKMTSDQLRKRIATIEDRAKKPLPSMKDSIAVGERIFYLDSVSSFCRYGPDVLSGNAEASDAVQSFTKSATMTVMRKTVDWDSILEHGNQMFDDMGEALSKPTYRERVAAVEEIYDDIEAYARKAQDRSPLLDLLAGRTGLTRRMQAIFVSLMMPAVQGLTIAEQRSQVLTEMARIAMVLELIRQEKGTFPESLEPVKDYLGEIPSDKFAEGQSYLYRRQGDGFILYSVGTNGRDDGGTEDQQLDEVIEFFPLQP